MAGIYIHIPFCKQACHYCNFHFSTSLRHRDEMVTAICKEIDLQKDFLTNKNLTTIYFGGGTPSLLETSEINQILERLSKNYSWKNNIEITLEANPDDITTEKISKLRAGGVNRLSIGIQSFIDSELLASNRAHNSDESLKAVQICQDAGIDNLSIDIIYGMPGSTQDSWQYNIDKALELDVDHISSYALTVEPKTFLDRMVKKGGILLPKEIEVNKQYLQLIHSLTTAGYDHYEISNFAKPSRYAVHNTNYWMSVPYLGLGPSAHSYQPTFRQWNINNNAKYIKSISKGVIPSEREQTKYADQFNEYIMTRLRTMWGVDLNELNNRFSSELKNVQKNIAKYIKSQDVLLEDNHYRLTPKGKLLADGIASDLFLVEE
ncbi:MAG: radical SAM family heme chaperone HemW [Saprospiraceae bacterium]|nr:radical SAM family heme chaperone HemW [Saprospiraceae bacterium]